MMPNEKMLMPTLEEMIIRTIMYFSHAFDTRCIDSSWSLIQIEKNMKPLRPYERCDTLKQYLEHDRKVLCFNCFWDDTESVFGDVRELILHYFLADDTIEICEVIPPNSGRDVSKFLRRSKLLKVRHHDRICLKLCQRLWGYWSYMK